MADSPMLIRAELWGLEMRCEAEGLGQWFLPAR